MATPHPEPTLTPLHPQDGTPPTPTAIFAGCLFDIAQNHRQKTLTARVLLHGGHVHTGPDAAPRGTIWYVAARGNLPHCQCPTLLTPQPGATSTSIGTEHPSCREEVITDSIRAGALVDHTLPEYENTKPNRKTKFTRAVDDEILESMTSYLIRQTQNGSRLASTMI